MVPIREPSDEQKRAVGSNDVEDDTVKSVIEKLNCEAVATVPGCAKLGIQDY